MKSCSTCKFWAAAKRWSHMAGEHVTSTECRHSPPDGSNGWPVVRSDDWCAAHELFTNCQGGTETP